MRAAASAASAGLGALRSACAGRASFRAMAHAAPKPTVASPPPPKKARIAPAEPFFIESESIGILS